MSCKKILNFLVYIPILDVYILCSVNFFKFFVGSVLRYEMSMIKNNQQRLYSMSGNSYYKPLGLVEGSE